MVFYQISFTIFSFVLGASVGSFLNTVSRRLLRNEAILGRSHCEHCGKTLLAKDLIPILSFFFLSRKCRFCQKPLSWHYPLGELATALLFAFTSFYFFPQLLFIFYLFIIESLLIIVFTTDFLASVIPVRVVYLGIVLSFLYEVGTRAVGLGGSYFLALKDPFARALYTETDFFRNKVFFETLPLLWAIVGASVIALFFWLLRFLTKGRAMGEGDPPLGFWVGMVAGFPSVTVALFTGFLSGSLVSVYLLLSHKKKFGQYVPLGPFLVLGTLLAVFFGEELINWYIGSFGSWTLLDWIFR